MVTTRRIAKQLGMSKIPESLGHMGTISPLFLRMLHVVIQPEPDSACF